jgi:hypothetical protein
MKYAPRLKSFESRLQRTTRIPVELLGAIIATANKIGCSQSWVVEQIILDWAGIDVEYRDVPKRKLMRNGKRVRKNG